YLFGLSSSSKHGIIFNVIPAKAGIHGSTGDKHRITRTSGWMDPCFRRGDERARGMNQDLSKDEVLTKVRGSLGLITLNRPQALNALTLEMIRQVCGALRQWENTP